MNSSLVVVTGGTGCIGSFLVELLLEKGATVRVPFRNGYGHLEHIANQIEWMQGDLSDPDFCKTLLQGTTHLVHLAAFRQNIDFHTQHRDEVIEKNVQMTTNLIGACAPSIHVTFFSTALLGTVDNPIDASDGYIAGKAVCEELWQKSALRLLLLRPVNVYGPRDRFGEGANVIPALMAKAKKEEETLSVWGSGKQERSFLYAPDLAMVAMAFIENGSTGVRYITPPEVLSIADLSVQIVQMVKPGLHIVFDTSHEEGALSMPSLPLDPLLQDITWTPLSEGLRETFEWCQNTLHSSV
jgi:nucleoside-diphosphate-sugar epimerase